nr:hypothetical protein [Tanacetum cinerariifolium]
FLDNWDTVYLWRMFHNYDWLADLYMPKRILRSGMYQWNTFREKEKKDGRGKGGIGAKVVEKGVQRPTKIGARRDAWSYREVLNNVKSFEEGSVNVNKGQQQWLVHVQRWLPGYNPAFIIVWLNIVGVPVEGCKVNNKVPSTLHEDKDQDCIDSEKSCEFEGFDDEGEEVEKTNGYNPHDEKVSTNNPNINLSDEMFFQQKWISVYRINN